VDLDLDLIVSPDGRAYERDHGVFERNRVAMGYSSDVVAAAHEGIAFARHLFMRKAAPFDGSPAELLGGAIAAQGPL
jgi:protein associated with RNAse G/E